MIYNVAVQILWNRNHSSAKFPRFCTQAHYDADIFGRAQEQTILHGAKWLFNSSLSEANNFASAVKGMVASAGNITIQTVGAFRRP